jgi:hypothetical protein
MSATLEPTRKDTAKLPDAARNYAITIPIKSRYDNWINGQFRAPVKGQYFSNPTPITGQHLCDVWSSHSTPRMLRRPRGERLLRPPEA